MHITGFSMFALFVEPEIQFQKLWSRIATPYEVYSILLEMPATILGAHSVPEQSKI